ncbi:hypothetical protein Agub_g15111, partial [Astrephomene gubernaculifera]
MVWASQDNPEDAAAGVESVKVKPLKKRCGSRNGLSRYYSSKSQSFSSLDLVHCTQFGNSALALAKRPSSFDLRRHGGSLSPQQLGVRCSSLATSAGARSSPQQSIPCMDVFNEEEDSAPDRCPCNDTIFTDPSEAFISPEGSPSVPSCLGNELYGNCSLASVFSTPQVAQEPQVSVQRQCQQLQNSYLSHLSALLPIQQGRSSNCCCGGTSSTNSGCYYCYCNGSRSTGSLGGSRSFIASGSGFESSSAPSYGENDPRVGSVLPPCQPHSLRPIPPCASSGLASGSGGVAPGFVPGSSFDYGVGCGGVKQMGIGVTGLGNCTSPWQPLPPLHQQQDLIAPLGAAEAAAVSRLRHASCSSDLNNCNSLTNDNSFSNSNINNEGCIANEDRPSVSSCRSFNANSNSSSNANLYGNMAATVRSRNCSSAGGSYPAEHAEAVAAADGSCSFAVASISAAHGNPSIIPADTLPSAAAAPVA